MPLDLSGKVLSWKEAENLFIHKVGYPSKDFYALEEFARRQGFTVTRVATYQMVLRVKKELERVISTGGNLAEFTAWATTNFPAWSSAYTRLVFRQSVFGSYSAARFRQINHPDVAKVFEILIYDAVADDRTREEHARMGGTQWKRSEFPSGWWPPNGFNCRCEVRTVTKKAARSLGTKRWNPKKDGAVPKPDKGFTRNYSDPESRRLLSNNLLRNLKKALGT